MPDSFLAACTADTSEAPPYEMTFSFENATRAPLAVAIGGVCGQHYTVTSCADGYNRPVQLAGLCGAICPNTEGCSDGACYPYPIDVSPGTPRTESWDGNRYSPRNVAGGTCYEPSPLEAGRYRITVPVFQSVDPSVALEAPLEPLYSVVVDFVLPIPGGVVHVPLDRPLGDAGPDAMMSDATRMRDARACVPIVARRYEAPRDCYDAKVTLSVCLEESAPETTSGLAEMACLVAPDGKRYAITKGYTECLSASAAGWSVQGDTGLCEARVDSACAAVIARGNWALSPLGPVGVDFATSRDAGGPSNDLVEECR